MQEGGLGGDGQALKGHVRVMREGNLISVLLLFTMEQTSIGTAHRRTTAHKITCAVQHVDSVQMKVKLTQ